MKKNIIFFAYSAVDLIGLYEALIPKYNVIWVVFHKDVYEFLKKKNIEQVYFISLASKILSSNNFFIKFLKFFVSFFNIKKTNKKFYKDLENIEKKYNPIIIFTDTSQPLADYKTKSLKINTKHSVCYKKYFLHEINFKYDYTLLPGHYHKERIEKIYKLKNVEEKFKVVGNIKISPFLKKNNFNKVKFMNDIKLDPNKTNVVFAPSWDAHGKDIFGRHRILPKSYGSLSNFLDKLSIETNILNCNFIIKLHHLSYFYLKNSIFKKIEKNKNCFVFKSGVYHDISGSNEICKISDILITDTSGIATTGIFLNKKLIFVNPSSYNWDFSDIEKELRPGFICNNFNDIIKALKNYLEDKDPYTQEKEDFVKKIFANPNIDANSKIVEILPEILNK